MSLFKNCKLIGSGIDPDEYNKPQDGVVRGDPRFIMRRSELVDFLSNPSKWKKKRDEESTRSLEWGTLMDTLVLDRARFDSKFFVLPATYYDEKSGQDKKWNANSTVCKGILEEHADQIPVKADDWDEAQIALAAITDDKEITALLECSDFQVMVTGEYHDRETGLVIPVKTLIDIVPKLDHGILSKALADFKTCRSADHRSIKRDIFEYGYDVQAAMSTDLYVAATGEDRCDWLLAIQENTHPYETARRTITSEFQQLGRMRLESGLRAYCWCLKHNRWPSYDAPGMWTFTQPEEWQARVVLESQWTPPEEHAGETKEESPELTP